MRKLILAAAFAGAFALPAAAQTTEGQVQAHTAAKVNVRVNESLANSAKITGDQAFAIASAHADNGEVSSAELNSWEGRLIYDVKVLNKSKRASTVKIDAMTGEVVDAKQHGGLKSTKLHHSENKKLTNAKKDSAAKAP